MTLELKIDAEFEQVIRVIDSPADLRDAVILGTGLIEKHLLQVITSNLPAADDGRRQQFLVGMPESTRERIALALGLGAMDEMVASLLNVLFDVRDRFVDHPQVANSKDTFINARISEIDPQWLSEIDMSDIPDDSDRQDSILRAMVGGAVFMLYEAVTSSDEFSGFYN